jgi:Caspase domain
MLMEVAGVTSAAVTHGFVVGVSHYPFVDGPDATHQGEELGLANLGSAARSASEVAAWLLADYHNPDAPLASLRLLVSPAPGESLHADVAARMAGQEAAATRTAVKEEFGAFREACRANPDNVAFVFFVGHGIQLNRHGAIVLLHDFATPDEDDLLFGAVDVLGCWNAMNEAGGAQHQIWFSDACRQKPEIVRRFESLSGAYAPGNQSPGNVAASPLFLSSSTREQAFADPAGLTVFTQALLWALRGAAASGPEPPTRPGWHVSSARLSQLLPTKVQSLLAASGVDTQSVEVTGRANDVTVQRFEEAPQVDIEVAINPPDVDPQPVATLLYEGKEHVAVDPGWPLRVRGAAGLYSLAVVSTGAVPRTGAKLVRVDPPECRDSVELELGVTP